MDKKKEYKNIMKAQNALERNLAHIARWQQYHARRPIFINMIRATKDDLTALDDPKYAAKVTEQVTINGALHVIIDV